MTASDQSTLTESWLDNGQLLKYDPSFDEQFNKLWQKYLPRARLFTLKVWNRQLPNEVDDILMQASKKVWRAFGNIRDRQQFWSILCRAIIREGLSIQRVKSNEAPLSLQGLSGEKGYEDFDPPAPPDPSEVEADSPILTVVASLPESVRRVIQLRMEDYTYVEIAELTRVPIGTVRSRINRAKPLIIAGLIEAGLNTEFFYDGLGINAKRIRQRQSPVSLR